MKFLQNKAKLGSLLAFAATSAFAARAFAAPVDVTSLTAAVDFSSVITAILAVAAIMVGVYVAWKAAKMVIGSVKGL